MTSKGGHDPFLSVSEAAERLKAAGVPRTNQTVRDWLRDGKVMGHWTTDPEGGSRLGFVDAEDLERKIAELQEKGAEVARVGDVEAAITQSEESAITRLLAEFASQSAEFRPLIEQILAEAQSQRKEVTSGIASLGKDLRNQLATMNLLLEIIREMQARQIEMAANSKRAVEDLDAARAGEREYQAQNLELGRGLLEEQRKNRELMERWEARVEQEAEERIKSLRSVRNPRPWWRRIFDL